MIKTVIKDMINMQDQQNHTNVQHTMTTVIIIITASMIVSVSPPNNNNNAMQQFQNSIIYINIRACTILPVKVVEPNI